MTQKISLPKIKVSVLNFKLHKPTLFFLTYLSQSIVYKNIHETWSPNYKKERVGKIIFNLQIDTFFFFFGKSILQLQCNLQIALSFFIFFFFGPLNQLLNRDKQEQEMEKQHFSFSFGKSLSSINTLETTTSFKLPSQQLGRS